MSFKKGKRVIGHEEFIVVPEITTRVSYGIMRDRDERESRCCCWCKINYEWPGHDMDMRQVRGGKEEAAGSPRLKPVTRRQKACFDAACDTQLLTHRPDRHDWCRKGWRGSGREQLQISLWMLTMDEWCCCCGECVCPAIFGDEGSESEDPVRNECMKFLLLLYLIFSGYSEGG